MLDVNEDFQRDPDLVGALPAVRRIVRRLRVHFYYLKDLNALTSLRRLLEDCPLLKELELDGHNGQTEVTDLNELENVLDGLAHNPPKKLRKFKFTDYRGMNRDYTPLPPDFFIGLGQVKSLEEISLDLSNPNVGESINRALSGHLGIQRVHLVQSCPEIGSFLLSLPNLCALHLREPFGVSTSPVGEYLPQLTANLTCLNLKIFADQIQNGMTVEEVEHIVRQALCRATNLKVLDLKHWTPRGRDPRMFATVISQLQELESLTLHCVQDVDLALLSQCPKLKQLACLDDEGPYLPIPPDGWLEAALDQLAGLDTLLLPTWLGSEKCEELLRLIQTNTSITKLTFWVGEDEEPSHSLVEQLRNTLTENTTLKSLTMDYQENFVPVLEEVIGNSTQSLEELTLTMIDADFSPLWPVLEKDATLVRLSLDFFTDDQYPQDTWDAMLKLIRGNRRLQKSVLYAHLQTILLVIQRSRKTFLSA